MISRRRLIAGAALGSVGSVLGGCQAGPQPIEPMSEEGLVASSALSGDPLTLERVRDQKPFLDFLMKEIQLMREFDPGDEDPITVFRIE
jgi:hypothetical protein